MALTDIVVKQLGLSWLDDDAMEVIDYQIEEGKANVGVFSPDFNPEKNAFDRALIVEYVRYARANARDDFYKNYSKELLSLSNRGRIARNGTDTDSENV